MRTYGQFCPIARASELIAERWTPIIVRNLLNGCRTFTEIRQGRLLLDGPPELTRAFPTWIRHSPFAGATREPPRPAVVGHRLSPDATTT
jgi:hypothetical protein